MKSKLTLIISFVLLLLCGMLAYVILKGDGPASDEVAGNAGPPPPRTSKFGNSAGTINPGSTRASRPRPRDAGTASHLVEKFGESRTGLSRKITTDMLQNIEK